MLLAGAAAMWHSPHGPLHRVCSWHHFSRASDPRLRKRVGKEFGEWEPQPFRAQPQKWQTVTITNDQPRCDVVATEQTGKPVGNGFPIVRPATTWSNWWVWRKVLRKYSPLPSCQSHKLCHLPGPQNLDKLWALFSSEILEFNCRNSKFSLKEPCQRLHADFDLQWN